MRKRDINIEDILTLCGKGVKTIITIMKWRNENENE